MREVSNNVILIDEFAILFDGFSIGLNALVQLTLGVDRDSETIAFDFDERYPKVKKMVGYLVETGIDLMGLNRDTVLRTTRHVVKKEKQ